MKKKEHKKKEILAFITDYSESNGIAPSIRKICEKMEISSTSTVWGYLMELENEGKIKRVNGKIAVPNRRSSGDIPILKQFHPNLFDSSNIEGDYNFPYGKTEHPLFAIKADHDNPRLMIMKNDMVIAEYQAELTEEKIAVYVNANGGFDFCKGLEQRENTIGIVLAVIRIAHVVDR